MQDKRQVKQSGFDVVRKAVFTGCHSIGYGAAVYLLILAVMTVQNGVSL